MTLPWLHSEDWRVSPVDRAQWRRGYSALQRAVRSSCSCPGRQGLCPWQAAGARPSSDRIW